MKFDEAPNNFKAADAHNIAQTGESVFDYASLLSSAEETETEADNVGTFTVNYAKNLLGSSLASGAVGLINTVRDIVNFTLPVDQEYAPLDTLEILAAADSDMAAFYEEHKTGSDVIGFLASSAIPTTLGLKAFRGFQTALRGAESGLIGTNTSLATRLLVPNTELQVKIHGAQLAARNSAWKLFNQNTLKTIGSGVHQGLLEGIVAESIILATNYRSPLFDDFTTSDYIDNFGIGVAIGGPLGAIGGLGASYFGTKRLLKAAQAREYKLATQVTSLLTGSRKRAAKVKTPEGEEFVTSDLADSILAAVDDIDRVAKPVTYDDVLALKKAQNESGYSISDEAINQEVEFLNRQRELNIEKLRNQARKAVRELQGGTKDDAFGNLVADIYEKADKTGVFSTFTRMEKYTRLAVESRQSKDIKQLMKSANITREEAEAILGPDPTKYITLHSGAIGETVGEAPKRLRMADSLSFKEVKEKIIRSANKLTESIKFNIDKYSSESFIETIELRWAAARHLSPSRLEEFGTLKNPVYEDDLPVLRELLKRGGDREVFVKTTSDTGIEYTTSLKNQEELEDFYRKSQFNKMRKLLEKGASADEIELITDIRADVINGKVTESQPGDNIWNAQEYHAKALSARLGKQITDAELYALPKYMKVSYLDEVVEEESANILRGMQGIAYRQEIYQEAADRAVAMYLGEDAGLFIPITKSLLAKAWRGGTGQGFVHGAGGDYGSLESVISQNGNIVSKLEQKVIAGIRQELQEATQILISNPKIAARFSALNEMLAGLPIRYTFSGDKTGLIPTAVRDWEDGITKSVPNIPKDAPRFIPVEDPQLYKVLHAHMARDFTKNAHRSNIASPMGNGHTVKFEFYPVRQDPRQFKHVAFVIDETMTGVGHKRMLLARSAEELQEQIRLVPKIYKVVTKTQAEDFHKAVGDWTYDATLHDNYLDSELASKGIRSNYFPMTDPKLIADTFLQHHVRNETALFRESVKTKFQAAIDVLEKRGQLYANVAESSTDHISKLQESSRNNPYMAMVKSLLNISRLEDVPGYWLSAQRALDSAVSKAWNRVTDVVRNSRLASPQAIAIAQKAFYETNIYHPEFSQFTTTGQALEFIATKSGNKYESELAKALMPYVNDVPFTVVESGVSVPGGVPPTLKRAYGIFAPLKNASGKIFIRGQSFGTSSTGINNITVLHEALHSAIHNKLWTSFNFPDVNPIANEAVGGYYKLWKDFKDALEEGKLQVPAAMQGSVNIMYNDVYEFATYALTEPRIMAMLDQLPGKLGSKIIDNVADMIGLKKKSALVDLVKATEDIAALPITPELKKFYSQIGDPEDWVDKIISETEEAFNHLGFRPAYWGAAEQIFANTRVDHGTLTTFLRTAHAFLTNTVLRWDPINAVINKISLPIIMGPEIRSLISAIKAGDPEKAGDLSRLSEVIVPGTNGDRILSPYKLVGNAYKMLHSEGAGEILRELKRRGIVVDTLDQYYKGIDALTITGAETAKDLSKKTTQLREAIIDWGNRAAVATGNEYVERTNRAVAALVMKQITDVAVDSGIISDKEAWAYINLFVNRTNGVIRAAERPLMFQGPIGQAMGLFQSYQLNLMQQAFRHIGNGNIKYAAMMAGLQTSIFGATSLPGFNLINERLIGDAAGNDGHIDIQYSARSAFGEAADWLLYGGPSAFTNAALFTRGDVNPRSWTVVPNPLNPTELPAVSSFGRAMSSIKTAFQATTEGAPVWDSLLFGLEHLGLSRPLSGLAVSLRALGNEELRANSTQKNGQFLYANDLLSIATLARIAGAKPFDEAKMIDDFYRVNYYASKDRKRREKLGIAMKLDLLSDSEEAFNKYGDYAAEYAALGGNQSRFNAYFMQQYRNATTSQAKQLSERLGSPYGRNMQFLLGGTEGLSTLE